MKEVRLINPSGMCDCIRINIMTISSAITCSIWFPPPISVENATFIPNLLKFSPVSLCSSSGLRNAGGGGAGADHHILKQERIKQHLSRLGWFPQPACNFQPDILFGGGPLCLGHGARHSINPAPINTESTACTEIAAGLFPSSKHVG